MLAEVVMREARGSVIDVGTGCGVQALAALLGGAKRAVGVDISEEAVSCAQHNAAANGLRADFFQSDLFDDVRGEFDFIVCNPPYLPVERAEDCAWDGGRDGRRIIERFLDDFAEHLSPGGSLLLLHSSLADTARTLERLHASGFRTRTLAEKSFFFEKLEVIRASR